MRIGVLGAKRGRIMSMVLCAWALACGADGPEPGFDERSATGGHALTADVCDPNPCVAPPPATCVDAITRRTFESPGLCTADGEQAACEYAPADARCPEGTRCFGGACSETLPEAPDWCRARHLYLVHVYEGLPLTLYGRVREAGITDRSPATDLDPRLRAQAGIGPGGSDPATEAGWLWMDAEGNPGRSDQSDPGADEYVVTVNAPGPGRYDHAYRFSADGGLTWTYCDLDGSDDGYEIADAGHFEVPVDPCDGAPCVSPPAGSCEDEVFAEWQLRGCVVIDGVPSCQYEQLRIDCAARGEACRDERGCVELAGSEGCSSTPRKDGVLALAALAAWAVVRRRVDRGHA